MIALIRFGETSDSGTSIRCSLKIVNASWSLVVEDRRRLIHLADAAQRVADPAGRREGRQGTSALPTVGMMATSRTTRGNAEHQARMATARLVPLALQLIHPLAQPEMP